MVSRLVATITVRRLRRTAVRTPAPRGRIRPAPPAVARIAPPATFRALRLALAQLAPRGRSHLPLAPPPAAAAMRGSTRYRDRVHVPRALQDTTLGWGLELVRRVREDSTRLQVSLPVRPVRLGTTPAMGRRRAVRVPVGNTPAPPSPPVQCVPQVSIPAQAPPAASAAPRARTRRPAPPSAPTAPRGAATSSVRLRQRHVAPARRASMQWARARAV